MTPKRDTPATIAAARSVSAKMTKRIADRHAGKVYATRSASTGRYVTPNGATPKTAK